MSDNQYPIGGYAPGNYYCKCSTCGNQFQGDKRAFQCEPCGTKSEAEWNALTPQQQQERVKKSTAIYLHFLKTQTK